MGVASIAHGAIWVGVSRDVRVFMLYIVMSSSCFAGDSSTSLSLFADLMEPVIISEGLWIAFKITPVLS